MDLPKRKPTRLKGYDYSQNGCYFITICTKDRKEILSEIIIVGEGLRALPNNKLTSIGKCVEDSILFVNKTYDGVTIDKYVIMPNHIHMLVTLTGGHGNPPLQNIVGQIKSFTVNKFKQDIWQRSFHDHIIRHEHDYNEIWEYIDTNVLKWEKDCFYSK